MYKESDNCAEKDLFTDPLYSGNSPSRGVVSLGICYNLLTMLPINCAIMKTFKKATGYNNNIYFQDIKFVFIVMYFMMPKI